MGISLQLYRSRIGRHQSKAVDFKVQPLLELNKSLHRLPAFCQLFSKTSPKFLGRLFIVYLLLSCLASSQIPHPHHDQSQVLTPTWSQSPSYSSTWGGYVEVYLITKASTELSCWSQLAFSYILWDPSKVNRVVRPRISRKKLNQKVRALNK